MDHLPLTASRPFEEIPAFPVPAGMESLLPELAPNGARPVEVTVTIRDGDSAWTAMDVVVAEGDAERAFRVAFGLCAEVEEYVIAARRFKIV